MSSSADIFLLIYMNFPTFLKCKEGVIIECIRIEQVWYYECIDWCLYQVVFFFIFCKDDSEMLRLSKKTIEFFHDVSRETS